MSLPQKFCVYSSLCLEYSYFLSFLDFFNFFKIQLRCLLQEIFPNFLVCFRYILLLVLLWLSIFKNPTWANFIFFKKDDYYKGTGVVQGSKQKMQVSLKNCNKGLECRWDLLPIASSSGLGALNPLHASHPFSSVCVCFIFCFSLCSWILFHYSSPYHGKLVTVSS